MEYGVHGDSYHNIPKAIFYLLKGDYRVLGFRGSGFRIMGVGV